MGQFPEAGHDDQDRQSLDRLIDSLERDLDDLTNDKLRHSVLDTESRKSLDAGSGPA